MTGWIVPDYGGLCFDSLPGTVERLLTGESRGPALAPESLGAPARAERVLLVYFDAFGWRFLERYEDHPFLRRAHRDGVVLRLTSQFPPTTTAHHPTIHTGLGVGEHGLYEWFVLDPSLGRLVCPLMFSFAGDDARGTLEAAGIESRDLVPHETLYTRLAARGVPSAAAQPRSFTFLPPNDALLAGATVLAYADAGEGLAALAAFLARPGYGFLYLDRFDSAMHTHGRDSAEADASARAILDALEGGLAALPPGTLVLVTADHGMERAAPERTTYVNEVWPELAQLLVHGADGRPLAPAGSCRDLFLHVLPEHRDDVVATLGERLEGVGTVHAVDELLARGMFGPAPGERLLGRLANVVCFAEPGEALYWIDPPRFVQRLRAQHGGPTAAEMEIPLVVLAF